MNSSLKKNTICFFIILKSIIIALPCDLNPDQCKNNGTCKNDNAGSFVCECPNGYSGQTCETRLYLNTNHLLAPRQMDNIY